MSIFNMVKYLRRSDERNVHSQWWTDRLPQSIIDIIYIVVSTAGSISSRLSCFRQSELWGADQTGFDNKPIIALHS
jgi:hypothetical protein